MLAFLPLTFRTIKSSFVEILGTAVLFSIVVGVLLNKLPEGRHRLGKSTTETTVSYTGILFNCHLELCGKTKEVTCFP